MAKKALKIGGIIVGVLALLALLLVLTFPPLTITFFDFVSDILVSDHSAEQRGQDTIYWNGSYYDTCNGEYREGKTIAKTSDGSWDINEVKEDPSHTFLVMRSFLDQYLLVKRDYTLPPEAAVTTAYLRCDGVNDQGVTRTVDKITDEVFLRSMAELSTGVERSLTRDPDADDELFAKLDILGSVSLTYENCPLSTATIPVGEIGMLDGQWVILTQHTWDYGIIPDKYIAILSPYFN